MTWIAAWGFVLAKVATVAAFSREPGVSAGLGALCTALASDGAVVLWIAAAEGILSRFRATGPRARWAPLIAGGAMGLLALSTIQPLTAALALTLVFLATTPLVARATARLAPGATPVLLAIVALYTVSALVTVQSTPRDAAMQTLHRSPLVDAIARAVAPSRADRATPDADEGGLQPPTGSSWTRAVRYSGLLKPKHVVLWVTPSTPPATTSLYNPRVDTTPNLDRLKANSLRFTRFYANAPTQEKSVFSMLCGMHPYPASASIPDMNPRIACPSLIETLGAQGYRSGLFSGLSLGLDDLQKFLVERGLDAMIDADTVPDRSTRWTHRFGVDDGAAVDAAIRWLDARPDPDQPLLTILLAGLPSAPFDLPPAPGLISLSPSPSRRIRHQRSVLYNDAQFGRLHDAFTERALADDTLFIYVGSHGQPMGEHPNNRHPAEALYEENVHVPLALFNARLFPLETVSQRMGSHVDLLPTLLELLGKPIPEEAQGQSLVARDFTYRPVQLGAFLRDTLAGMRHGHFKYVHDVTLGEDRLFDLSVDPNERDDLAPQFDPERLATWRARVVAHQAEQRSLLTQHPSHGVPYLHRAYTQMEVALVDESRRVACDAPGPAEGWRSCPNQPEFMELRLAVRKLRAVNRECMQLHPPEKGALELVFPSVSPPPRYIGGGLEDFSRRTGGAPVEITWTLGDREPVRMIVDDADATSYDARRIDWPDGVDAVAVKVEVRTDDWSDRRSCLVLAP